jgi:putative endonuclease
MKHVVYILYSTASARYYCGETADLENRLARHNSGRSKATKYGAPWELIHVVACKNRSEARKLETNITKRGISRWLESNL